MKKVGKYMQLFQFYNGLGTESINRLTKYQLLFKPGLEDNSIAIIATHIAGNLLSRFSDFLTSDGEKEWRNRDTEFEDILRTKEEVIAYWNKGWKCLFDILEELSDEDLDKVVYIRSQAHTVEFALMRQLSHHAYHVGQIVLLAKMQLKENWTSLSIPKGGSQDFNQKKSNEDGDKPFFTR